MAFSISPKHEKEIELEGLSKEEFLVLAIEAAKDLKWNVGLTGEHGFLAYTGFSFSSYGEEIKISIHNNSSKIKSECTGSQLFDYGKNKRNVEEFVLTLSELKVKFSPEDLSNKFEELKKSFSGNTNEFLEIEPIGTKSKTSGFISLFIPTKGYFVTPILINLNILIFLIMAISGVSAFDPTGEDLIKWGANFRPSTLDYGWWRLLSCCFLHIGVFHLLMNMYALMYIGVLLEPILGSARFITAYLVTGIVASLTSLVWNDFIISAGASGAIFGMYGVFLAMLTTNLIEKSARRSLLTSIAIFVGYNLLNGVKGGIDNAAHVGGLISGLLVGYIYYPNLRDNDSPIISKTASISISYIIVIIAVAISAASMTNYSVIYEENMKKFVSLEEEALMVYNLSDTTSNASVLRIIKNPGISNWKNCVEIIEGMKSIDLPKHLKERNKLLKYYCRLRIESYKRMYELIQDSTKTVTMQVELEKINKKIEKVINDLSVSPN